MGYKRCKQCGKGMSVQPSLMKRKKYCSKICQNLQKKGRRISPATEFQPGQAPLTLSPIGTESESKGYIRVKVAEPNIWRQRSHIVWEEVNKKPLPEGWIVRHADDDPLNDDPENLIAMSRGKNLKKTLETPEIRERKLRMAGRAAKRRWKAYREEKLNLEQYDSYYWEGA